MLTNSKKRKKRTAVLARTVAYWRLVARGAYWHVRCPKGYKGSEEALVEQFRKSVRRRRRRKVK